MAGQDDDHDLNFDLDFGRPLLSQQEPKRGAGRFSVFSKLFRPRSSGGVDADLLTRKAASGGGKGRLRKVGKAVAVLVVGGGLGVGGFYLSTMQPRDMIAILDVGDIQPHLSYSMPSRSIGGAVPATNEAGGMLTPPVNSAPETAKHDGADAHAAAPAAAEAHAPQAGQGAAAAPPNAHAPDAAHSQDGHAPDAPAADAHAPDSHAPDTHAADSHAAADHAPAVHGAPSAPPPPLPAVAPAAPLPALPTTPNATPDQPTPRAPDQAPTYANLPDSLAPRKPLGAVVVDGLTQTVAAGVLPVIGPDGRLPWKIHSMPFDAPAAKPRVAVLVTNLGLDRDATEAAISKLPPEVTLVFSPYAGGLEKWMKKARDKGHEIMISLPTEPVGYPANDPGPLGLLKNADQATNSQQLDKNLARLLNYVGVLVPDGPFAQSDQLGLIFAACKQRGLLYVGPRLPADPQPPAALVSNEIGLDLFRDAIDAELDRAGARAVQTGSAVLVVSAKPATFARLLSWFDKINSLGMVVSPIGSVVKQGKGK